MTIFALTLASLPISFAAPWLEQPQSQCRFDAAAAESVQFLVCLHKNAIIIV